MFEPNKQNKRGFSLVELVIAIALGISILAGLMIILSNQFFSTTAFSVRHKVNEKFDIAQNMIRFEAMGNYHAMTRANQLMSVAVYPEIELRVTIQDENPATKTRTANLTASYFVGRGTNRQVETKTRSFEFGNSYGTGTGASIQIRVFREGFPANGVSGIYVETVGEGTPIVSGYTGPDGQLVLFGVKESSVNIRLSLNASSVRCYFPSGTGGEFTKDVHPSNPASETQSGQPPVLFDDVGVHMPGVVEGVVRDAGSTSNPQAPVANMAMRLYPVEVPVGNLNTTESGQLEPNPISTVSGTGGIFRFPRVIPGEYYLQVRGGTSLSNEEWVAVDVPGSTNNAIRQQDTFWNGGRFPGVILVTSSQTLSIPSVLTVRTGRLWGDAKVLTAVGPVGAKVFDLVNFPTANNTPIEFFTEKDQTWTNQTLVNVSPPGYLSVGPSGIPTIPWYFPWRERNNVWGGTHAESVVGRDWFVANNSQFGYEVALTNGTGQYELKNRWPQVVFRGQATNPMPEQFYVINPFYQVTMPVTSNATPVGVIVSGTNVQFHIRSVDGGFQFLPRSAFTTETPFLKKIYANWDVPSENNQDLFFLERSNDTFARIRGRINTPGQPGSGWVESFVESVFTTGNNLLEGSGLLVLGLNGWSIKGSHFHPMTPAGPPETYEYDMFENGQNMIVPTVGGDQQTLIARFSSPPLNVNSQFVSRVLGLAKLTPNAATYSLLPPSSVNLTNVSFSATAIGNPAQTINGTVDVVNGNFSPAVTTNQTQYQERREAPIGPFSYAPGQFRDGHNFGISAQNNVLRDYRVVLTPVNNSGWRRVLNDWNDPWRIFLGAFVNAPPLPNPSATFQPIDPGSNNKHFIPTFLVEAYFKLRGTVIRFDNSFPVVGATVRVSGANLADTSGANVLEIVVQTNALGEFDFTPSSADYLRVTPLLNEDSIFLDITPPANTQLLPVHAGGVAWQAAIGSPMPAQVVNIIMSEEQGQGNSGSF